MAAKYLSAAPQNKTHVQTIDAIIARQKVLVHRVYSIVVIVLDLYNFYQFVLLIVRNNE
jgi:hypothetical protein